jgi:hypothetical protein
MPNLARIINFVRVSNAVAAGVTLVTGTHVDLSAGYDGVLFLFALGTLTAGQVTSFKAQGGSLANDSDMADLAGTAGGAALVVADTDSNKLFALDIYAPQQRYVRPLILRATANAVVDGIFALLYQGAKMGYGLANSPALDATVKALAVLASPLAGTP